MKILSEIRRKARAWTRPGDFRLISTKGEFWVALAGAWLIGIALGVPVGWLINPIGLMLR